MISPATWGTVAATFFEAETMIRLVSHGFIVHICMSLHIFVVFGMIDSFWGD